MAIFLKRFHPLEFIDKALGRIIWSVIFVLFGMAALAIFVSFALCLEWLGGNPDALSRLGDIWQTAPTVWEGAFYGVAVIIIFRLLLEYAIELIQHLKRR